MATDLAYDIVVAIDPDPRLRDWLGDVTLHPGPDATTCLRTPPIDQTALRGLLSTIFNLNLGLLAVRSLPAPPESAGEPAARCITT